MATFDFCANPGAQRQLTPKVREAEFGDGYSQRVGDGINTQKSIWNVAFTRDKSEIDQIDAFLIARSGVESFDWIAPDGSSGRYLCKSWSRDYPFKDVQTLSAQFNQVFGES